MIRYDIAERINKEVNNSIEYVADIVQYGTQEHWTIPKDGKGDCEDISLAKRASLIEAGASSDDIFLCTCTAPNGQGHLVLLVMTDKGGMIADNADDSLRVPSMLPYTDWNICKQGKWYKVSWESA